MRQNIFPLCLSICTNTNDICVNHTGLITNKTLKRGIYGFPLLEAKTKSHFNYHFKRSIINFVALDKLSTLCPNSIQFHYIPLQFSIKFEQECNNNFIIALLLGLQCNNNLLLHSCSNFIQNQCLINETNTTLPTVPTLKIF